MIYDAINQYILVRKSEECLGLFVAEHSTKLCANPIIETGLTPDGDCKIFKTTLIVYYTFRSNKSHFHFAQYINLFSGLISSLFLFAGSSYPCASSKRTVTRKMSYFTSISAILKWSEVIFENIMFVH